MYLCLNIGIQSAWFHKSVSYRPLQSHIGRLWLFRHICNSSPGLQTDINTEQGGNILPKPLGIPVFVAWPVKQKLVWSWYDIYFVNIRERRDTATGIPVQSHLTVSSWGSKQEDHIIIRGLGLENSAKLCQHWKLVSCAYDCRGGFQTVMLCRCNCHLWTAEQRHLHRASHGWPLSNVLRRRQIFISGPWQTKLDH